jgi:hypothetical protein
MLYGVVSVSIAFGSYIDIALHGQIDLSSLTTWLHQDAAHKWLECSVSISLYDVGKWNATRTAQLRGRNGIA